MPNFGLQPIVELETRQPVNKLIRNGKCLLDEFVNKVKSNKNLEGKLGDLFAIIQYVANGTTPFLPPTKFKKLKLSKHLKYSGYEAKSKPLRLYLFMEKRTGMILVLGGIKGSQDADINYLEKVIKEYTQL